MWEEALIFMLIYLGVFFILPDKIRNQILTNGLLCTTLLAGFLAGIYGSLVYTKPSEGFYQAGACGNLGTSCIMHNPATPYCLFNEKRLPTSDVDQTVLFNIYGRYVRIYPPETGGDGHCLLSQVVVKDAAGTNIALNKTATATGTLAQAGRNASSVVDGTLSPQRTWPNIWHSASNNRVTEYWQVDLGSVQMITSVRVMAEGVMNNPVNGARILGLRVVVLQATTDVPNVKGTCVAMPTPIYPAGTTADEQKVIGPLILDGLNGEIALKVYRGIESRPSTFTTYGLTDSESAAAALKIKSDNLMAERSAKSRDDNSYYSEVEAMKTVTTMAGIRFDVSDELRKYMERNIINTSEVNPVTGAIIRTVSDKGLVQTTKTIMGVLKSKAVDPSASYSQQTLRNENVSIPAPPNTGNWAESVAQNLPTEKRPISLPKSGETTITKSMTPAQKEAAVKANNPSMIVITPTMTPAQRAAAIAAANSSQNVAVSNTPLTREEMDAASSSTSSGQGYSTPALSQGAGGQQQWYMRTVAVPYSQAATQCTNYNGRLATLQQIRDAQTAGASYTTAGWYSDTSTAIAYPKSNGVQTATPGGGNHPVNCYGPKPPPGTSDVAPWTDTAKIFPGGATYTVNDWSRRVGGDGGFDKTADGVSRQPGAALKTQEVYYVGGTQSINTEQSIILCKNLGGSLATNAQLQAAKSAGANWCGAGWLIDSGPAQAGSNCPGASSNGANCFGIKPSMDSAGANVGTVSASNSPVSFTLKTVPFSTTSTTSSWSQTGQDQAANCRTGQVLKDCKINNVDTPTCLNAGLGCDTVCAGSTIVNGVVSCPGDGIEPVCPSSARKVKCGTRWECLTSSDTCDSVANRPGADRPRLIVIPDDADKEKFTAIANRWLKHTEEYCINSNSDGSCAQVGGQDRWYFYSYTAEYQNLGKPEIVLLPVGYDKNTDECYVNNVYGVISGHDPATCKPACVWGGPPTIQTAFLGTYYGPSGGRAYYKTYECPDGHAKCLNCPSNQIGTASCPYVKQVRMYTCPMNLPTYGLKLLTTDIVQKRDFGVIARYVRVQGNGDAKWGEVSLSQLFVIDSYGNNIAKGKTVYVNGDRWPGSASPESIVDGVTAGRSWAVWHSATVSETNYIQVDLGSSQFIRSVIFYGRSDDCCYARHKGTRITLFQPCSRDSDCMGTVKCGGAHAGYCDNTIS